LIAPLWAAREGSPYLRHYRDLCRTQFDAPETIRERQFQKLRTIVDHASRTVPFYRDRLPEIRCWDEFLNVPLLTKADIRNSFDDLRSSNYRDQPLHEKKTSGSTGVPLRVLLDEAGMQFKRACTMRSDEWSGWRFGERVAKVWGNPEYLKLGCRGRLRNDWLDRADYLDTLQFTESALAAFAARCARRQPSLIFGHAHSVYLLASYVDKHGPANIRPKGIITSAMVLHDWQRKAIETVFGCRVTNRYGCEEVSLIASECEVHDGLHVNADGLIVEILANGKPAAPGQPGAVVVTDLVNRAMPIIRYKIGDVAVMSERHCPCGRGLPMIDRLDGRESDYVTTERGELISGISLTENFAMHLPGVAQLQIVQEAVTQFRFRIVRGQGFGDESLHHLNRLVRERFGDRTQYDLEFVHEIPQEPSGKYRFCISKVPVTL
jgi:phenylacetate-CoA ligase